MWRFFVGTFFRALERGTLTEDGATNENSDETSEEEGTCGETSIT
jgi:hypothetical protein